MLTTRELAFLLSGAALAAASGVLHWYLFSAFIAGNVKLAILGFLPTMLTGAAGYLAGYPFRPAKAGALAGAVACASGAILAAFAVPALDVPPPLLYAFVAKPPATAIGKIVQDGALGALCGSIASRFAEEEV